MTEALIGDQSIKDDITNYGKDSPYTQLNPGPFLGANPDNAEGEIPYEKGFQFLWHVFGIVGEYEWQGFLRTYFSANSQKSIWDFQMLDQLKAYLEKIYGKTKADQMWTEIDYESWLYTKDYPPKKADFSTPDSVDALAVSTEFLATGEFSQDSIDKWNNFYSNQRVLCLNDIINNKGFVNAYMVKNLYNQLNIANEKNLEITSRTTIIGLNAKVNSYVDKAEVILSEMGRLLYLQPLYRALKENGYEADMHRIYEKNASFYSPIARNTLKSIIDNPALYENDHMAEHWAQHKFFASRI